MAIKINTVHPKKEWIWLDVESDDNLRWYAVVDNTYTSEGKVSNKFRHIFEFPDFPVKAKDYVALIGGVGKRAPEKNDRGGTNYFFFWNSKEHVWNNEGDTAHLITYKIVSEFPYKKVE